MSHFQLSLLRKCHLCQYLKAKKCNISKNGNFKKGELYCLNKDVKCHIFNFPGQESYNFFGIRMTKKDDLSSNIGVFFCLSKSWKGGFSSSVSGKSGFVHVRRSK